MKESDDELRFEGAIALRKYAEFELIKEFVQVFEGNPKVVLEKIKKVYFFNEKTFTYKRVPQRIRKNIMQLCEEYKSL